jgi:HEAT repeat protein
MSESPSLEELVDILATDGLELEYDVAEAIVRHGEAAVPLLAELLLDEAYLDREWHGAEGWGPVHALYCLAELASPLAVPALMRLIGRVPESDFLTEGWIVAVGCVGEAAVEPVLAFIRDAEGDPVLRGATATRGLLEIGERWPELRQQIVDELAETIEDPSVDNHLRTWMMQSAAGVDDDALQAAIDQAFERRRVDTAVFDHVALVRMREMRGPNVPWAGGGAGREPLEHFERENLESLRTIIEVLPESGAGPYGRREG